MRGTGFSWSNWHGYYRSLALDRGAGAWVEGAGRAALGAVSAAGWALGRDAPLPQRAVLIVGHQRSGTTLLHRLLAGHPGLCAMPLHTLLLPADAFQRPLQILPRPAAFDAWQDRLFGALDSIHRIRLHEPEEDEFLLWATFRSPMNALDRPWPAGRQPAIDSDPVALAFYAQAVARHARRNGRVVVGKNPHFTWQMDELRRALPGVFIVHLVRHPARAIASRLSLIRAIWQRRFPALQGLQPHHVSAIYDSSLRIYRGGLRGADLDLAYAELVADPLTAAGRIVRAIGLADLPLALPGRHGGGPHEYSLEEFGLDRARVASDLAEVYSHWGMAERPDPGST